MTIDLTLDEKNRQFGAGRADALSTQIVSRVRDELFEKKLKPGDFLGTEMDLAKRYGVSRMAARDALRKLEPTNLTPADLTEWRKGGEDVRRVTPNGYFGDPRPSDPEL